MGNDHGRCILLQGLFDQLTWVNGVDIDGSLGNSFSMKDSVKRIQVDHCKNFFFQASQAMDQIVTNLGRGVEIALATQPLVQVTPCNSLNKMDSKTIFRPDSLDFLQSGKGFLKHCSQ